MLHPKSIVILDFGGQYAHLIGRRVRELGAYSEILPPDASVDVLKDAAGIILSGGPSSVYAEGSPEADPALFSLGIPVLGLCYGMQWMGQVLGGSVTPGRTKEYGKTVLEVVNGGGAVLQNVGDSMTVWMSHGDSLTELPPGFAQVGTSDSCTNAAIADESRHIYGLQYHPEVTHTEHGQQMLKNFVALCSPAPWSVDSFAAHIGEQIKTEVGDKNVFMLVSGGVDSTVAFTLLSEVLGPDRVQGLLVDTGLMRKDEIAQIQAAFAPLNLTNLHIEDASTEFFAALEGAYDPEQKRKIIGDTFLSVQKRVSEQMNLRIEDGWMLGQGTIYPDTIETGGTKHADHIKTHHNRVEAIERLIEAGLVIEPLKELYKDEVRKLGEEIGLPHELVWRHPFPGPGLGVRILCTDTKEQSTTTAEVTIPHTVLPIQSVGVQGDGRTYRKAIALYNDDPATVTDAAWGHATEIPNHSQSFNRVLQCISHSEPLVLETSNLSLTQDRADLLRDADNIVDEEMRNADLYEHIWQFPVVLLPLGLEKGGQSIVLRPVDSQDVMSANAFHLPSAVVQSIASRLLQLSGIDAVFYDLTSKPPGTIEWE